jgi:hypothetical protein
MEGGEIKAIDTGETPWLIFPHRHPHSLELLPALVLLLLKPLRKNGRASGPGQDGRGASRFPLLIKDC